MTKTELESPFFYLVPSFDRQRESPFADKIGVLSICPQPFSGAIIGLQKVHHDDTWICGSHDDFMGPARFVVMTLWVTNGLKEVANYVRVNSDGIHESLPLLQPFSMTTPSSLLVFLTVGISFVTSYSKHNHGLRVSLFALYA